MKRYILVFVTMISIFLMGCVTEKQKALQVENQKASLSYSLEELKAYMLETEEESNKIKESLENEMLNQTEMNLKSQELYALWDNTLNYFWEELKNNLPKEEFEKLKEEQLDWISDKERLVEEAGKEFAGGSIYSLIINSEAAGITEERVYVLYTLLKENTQK